MAVSGFTYFIAASMLLTIAPGQMVLLGVLFMLQTIMIFCSVAVFAGILGKKIISRPNVTKYVKYAKASIFTLIGIKLALTDR